MVCQVEKQKSTRRLKQLLKMLSKAYDVEYVDVLEGYLKDMKSVNDLIKYAQEKKNERK